MSDSFIFIDPAGLTWFVSRVEGQRRVLKISAPFLSPWRLIFLACFYVEDQAMGVVPGSFIERRNGRCSFEFEYKPKYQDFEEFRRWCMEPLQGPCWKAIATSVVPNIELVTEGQNGIELTDRGTGIARVGGGPSVKSILEELSKPYPPTPPLA